MAKRRQTFTSQTLIAFLSMLTLFFALLPVLPARSAYGDSEISLSDSVLSIGYPATTITVTGSALFPFRSNSQLTLYDANGQSMSEVSNLQIVDSNHLTFTLNPGLNQGKYTLVVRSYQTAMAELDVLTNYDPSHVQITPGVNRDIRIDWTDPDALNLQDIKIEYAPIDQPYSPLQVVKVQRGVQTCTLTNLQNNTAYKIRISSEISFLNATQGTEFTNDGNGYLAVDTTPPGDLTHLQVTSVTNGFMLKWTDPVDPEYPSNSDLNLITIQYAEHGTSNWSGGFVVAAGVQQALVQPLNLAKRYDFRFTKTDIYGNWSYQLDNHGGYGYTQDTTPPADVSGLHLTNNSTTSETLNWTDPNDLDFQHVNIYLRSPQTDWVAVGHANKGAQTYTLSNLAPNIDYTVKVTAVDSSGNETSGSTQTFRANTLSYTDLNNLSTVTVSQQVDGGLQLKWTSTTLSAVDFSQFRVYYAPVGTTDPTQFKQTDVTNKTTSSGSLEDIPTGTYVLELRFYDAYGVEQKFLDLNNGGAGFYVSGTQSGLPADVGGVQILPDNGTDMLITWTAATSTGTHVELYVAGQAANPNWRMLDKVPINNQRYTVTGLDPNQNYFFKLVVFDANKNTQSPGVVYDNSGYGYNLTGGDTHPPHDVVNAQATVQLGTIAVTYTEPTDPDFDSVNVYVYQMGQSQPVSHVNVVKGSNGTTLQNLLPGEAFSLKITTVDTVGNESNGVVLDNNGQGYTLATGSTSDPNEVRDALLIPQLDHLTVRFLDPLNTDYSYAAVSLKKAGDSDYSTTLNAYKGTNEVTINNLDRNALYQVRILAYNTAGQPSNGIYLGGDTGISLLPMADVANAQVTPGNNRLTVTWADPTTTAPSDLQVQFMPMGSQTWSEPIPVQPGTGKALIGGLPNDVKSYQVRITAVLHDVASPGVILANNGQGFSPRDVRIAANPPDLQADTSGQTIVINGTNTRFPFSSTLDTLTMRDENGQDVSSHLSGFTVLSGTQMQATLSSPLSPGTYTLLVSTPQDGQLQTTMQVLPNVSGPLLSTTSVPTVNNNYQPFTMVLTGTGFTQTATVTADNGTPLNAVYQSAQSLTVSVPSGLQPGTHKLYVTTSNGTSNPLAFTVYAFTGNLSLVAPTTRSGVYQANLSLTNLDANPRGGKVLFVIRRNGQFMESRSVTESFSGGQTQQIPLDFGGAGTPYANESCQNISIQAYLVDEYSMQPLSDPLTISQDLSL